MTRLAIIADDLSSATDCGAQMVRSGLSVVVPLGSYSLPEQARVPDVISIDTDSRSLSADQAYARVKAATQQLVSDGWTHFYKSVDSTLRGNLGAEIEAVMEVVKPNCAIIAPAFPKYGRTTADGVQYLRGIPLHETEFGTDPTAPVKDAHIVKRLAEGTSRKAARLSLQQVRSDAAILSSAVHALVAEGIELLIADIAEQDDLKRLCLGLSKNDLRIVWVGSTGLAEFVPLAFKASPTAVPLDNDRTTDSRPALALIGSASEVTQQQLSYAEINCGLKIIHLDPTHIIQGGAIAVNERNDAYRRLCQALQEDHNAALVVRASRAEIAATQQLGAMLKLSITQVAQKIVEQLAQVAHRLIQENRISGIVATGGDMANALCNALATRALEILGEVEAGIPIMRMLGTQSLPLVTKAGGFGSPAAIADALTKVKQYA